MEEEFLLNAEILPPFHLDTSTMATGQSLSSAPEFNCFSGQASHCYLSPKCDKSTALYSHFESAMTSMLSSPAASSSVVDNDNFAVRELMGKLGTIYNSGDMTPALLRATPPSGNPYGGGGTDIAKTSCYNTPLNSPPNRHLPMPNLRDSIPLHSSLPALSADPGFAERAAKFSSFGSRGFNVRTNPFGSKNNELPYRSNIPLMECRMLPRVSSSPSLKAAGSPMENNNFAQNHTEMTSANASILRPDKKLSKLSGSAANSNDESSVSEQKRSEASGSGTPNELNSRKRKALSRGKAKEDASVQSGNSGKGAGTNDGPNAKRARPAEGDESENAAAKTEEEPKSGTNDTEDDGQRDAKANLKPPEPQKDYIHVRARRGQATDSHSLAERVRREKISERMKLLQDLVPGCNKVTGKALMLDEIINYVQSLQRQVEFLSMKLASVNTRLDFSMDSLHSKDVCQPTGSLPHPMYPTDSSAAGFYGHQPQQSSQVDTSVLGGPPVAGLGEALPQLRAFCEDDLQSIVQMGFGLNPSRDSEFYSQSFSLLQAKPPI